MNVLSNKPLTSEFPDDDVNQTLGQIFDNDRWLWQSNKTHPTDPNLVKSSSTTPESNSARSAVFKGMLDRLFMFFRSLTHGTDASNHTRAKVLATSLFLSLDSHNSRAGLAARRCAQAFQALCANSSSQRLRSIFLQAHQIFTKLLLDRNHHFITSKASQLALVQYEHVLSNQGSDGFFTLQESINQAYHPLSNSPPAQLHLISFYAQILQQVVQSAFVITAKRI